MKIIQLAKKVLNNVKKDLKSKEKQDTTIISVCLFIILFIFICLYSFRYSEEWKFKVFYIDYRHRSNLTTLNMLK